MSKDSYLLLDLGDFGALRAKASHQSALGSQLGVVQRRNAVVLDKSGLPVLNHICAFVTRKDHGLRAIDPSYGDFLAIDKDPTLGATFGDRDLGGYRMGAVLGVDEHVRGHAGHPFVDRE